MYDKFHRKPACVWLGLDCLHSFVHPSIYLKALTEYLQRVRYSFVLEVAVNKQNQVPAFVKANSSTQVNKYTSSGTVGMVSVTKENKPVNKQDDGGQVSEVTYLKRDQRRSPEEVTSRKRLERTQLEPGNSRW